MERLEAGTAGPQAKHPDRAERAEACYRMGPFSLLSGLPLPELPSDERGNQPVRVRMGPVPESRTGLVPVDAFCAVSRTRYLLDIPGVARYLAEDGSRVTVEVAPAAVAADVRGYLLGSIFGALCHQNGMLPLHASAVARGSEVTAFLGHSGAGKSTTAAFLERRGYAVVSDDICLLDGLPEVPYVVPVAGWLKLWRESFVRLGETPDERTQVFSSSDKFRRYLPVPPARTLRLRHAVLLERAQHADDGAALTQLSPARSLMAMLDLTYLSYLPDALGEQAAQVGKVAAALAGVEVWRLQVPIGWERLPEALDLLEERLLGK